MRYVRIDRTDLEVLFCDPYRFGEMCWCWSVWFICFFPWEKLKFFELGFTICDSSMFAWSFDLLLSKLKICLELLILLSSIPPPEVFLEFCFSYDLDEVS